MSKLYKKTLLYCYLIKYVNRIENLLKRRTLHKNAAEILNQLNLVFKELNYDYWLEFGTLLGAVRENRIISFDLDLDIATWRFNYGDNLNVVMQRYGFKLMREIYIENEGIEQTYSFNNVNVDVFYCDKLDDDWIKCYVFYLDKNMSIDDMNRIYGGLHPLEIRLPFNNLLTYSFLGVDTKIPANYKSQLSYHYGTDYMIPNPNWDYRNASSSKQIPNKIGKVRFFQ